MRSLVLGIVGTLVWTGLVLGLLAIRAVDYGALSPRELGLLVGLAAAGPCAMTLTSLLRRWSRRAVSTLLRGLGPRWESDDRMTTEVEGIRVEVVVGTFEDANGKRRPAWIAQTAISPPPPWPDAHIGQALGRIGDLIGFRSGGETPGARIILERPLAQPIALRRAVLLLRDLGHRRPIQFEANEPPTPSPRAVARAAKPVTWLIAAGIWVASTAALIIVTPHTSGYERFVIDRANECALAADALGGGPIVRTQIALEWSSQSNRIIESEIRVHGARQEGRIDVIAYKRTRGTPATSIAIRSAVLDPGNGPTIELFSCARSWSNGPVGPLTFKPAVATVSGAAPVSKDTSCSVQVSPVAGVGGQLCRVVVDCGARLLYGATAETGYTDCWTARDGGRSALVARDLDRGASRVEAWLDLDERKKKATLGGPGWKVDLAW